MSVDRILGVNMLIRSLRKHERDDTVRFWAERDASVYWRSLMISSLITSPIIFVAPEAYVVATLVGLVSFPLTARMHSRKPSAVTAQKNTTAPRSHGLVGSG